MATNDLEFLRAPLNERSNSSCELCAASDELAVFAVPGSTDLNADTCALLCATCRQQIEMPDDAMANHWHCLTGTAWSDVPVIQVLAWRLLTSLQEHTWAADLRSQLYLDEATLAWADATDRSDAASGPPTIDASGNVLVHGDNVTILKELEIKGLQFGAKRGTVVRGIHLTDNPEQIEGRVNGAKVVLKTCFVRKVT